MKVRKSACTAVLLLSVLTVLAPFFFILQSPRLFWVELRLRQMGYSVTEMHLTMLTSDSQKRCWWKNELEPCYTIAELYFDSAKETFHIGAYLFHSTAKREQYDATFRDRIASICANASFSAWWTVSSGNLRLSILEYFQGNHQESFREAIEWIISDFGPYDSCLMG